MTAQFIAHVQQRLWRGYDDPGLPVGMYFTQGAVTGDASGGQMVVSFCFRAEGDAASTRFYNIEQMEVFHSDSANKTIALQAVNWDRVASAGLVNRQWHARLINNANGVAAMATDQQFPLPIFLGITSPVPDVVCEINVSTPNINITSFVATMQGYIWEGRSMLSQGGLRRPIDSLYGGGKQ